MWVKQLQPQNIEQKLYMWLKDSELTETGKGRFIDFVMSDTKWNKLGLLLKRDLEDAPNP